MQGKVFGKKFANFYLQKVDYYLWPVLQKISADTNLPKYDSDFTYSW